MTEMMNTPQAADPRVADLVRAGKIRVALYLPQYTKNPATGALDGWCVDVVHGLGARLGIAGVPVENSNPALAVECLKSGTADAAILGIVASRATDVDFSPPLVQADYACLVPAGSAIDGIADADRPGIRIAAVSHHASTLALNRIIKHATFVYADTPDGTFEIFRIGDADVFASLHEVLAGYAKRMPGSRVLPESYGFNSLGLAVPKGQLRRLAYLSEFVVAAKTSGLVQHAIDRSGWSGLRVAP